MNKFEQQTENRNVDKQEINECNTDAEFNTDANTAV